MKNLEFELGSTHLNLGLGVGVIFKNLELGLGEDNENSGISIGTEIIFFKSEIRIGTKLKNRKIESYKKFSK